MIKFIATIFFFFILSTVVAQTTFVIDNVPQHYTPMLDKIYLATDLNTWDPGNVSYQFTKALDGKYYLTFNAGAATSMIFKFTRGDWARVETSASGADISNRTFSFTSDTAHFTIAQWHDMVAGNNTATTNVFMLQSDFAIPQLNRTRRIWLYLPNDYYTSSTHYPVLYMQDAQNVLDAIYSFAGEWKVDEKLDSLNQHQIIKDCIVVGIENGPQRLDEYSAFVNTTYGGGEGDEYSDFLANTLKPFIDNNFRTLPQPEHTGIAGSSMGGLISLYAGLKYQNVFGRIGVFSPSLWFSNEMFTYAASLTHTTTQKIYFVAGQNESSDMVPDINNMKTTLMNSGYTTNELISVIKHDGQHSEWFWSREFPACYYWLDLWGANPSFVKDQSMINADPAIGWNIINNNDSSIKVNINQPLAAHYNLVVTDLLGRILWNQQISKSDKSVLLPSQLFNTGLYIFSLISENKTDTRKILILKK